MRCAVKVVEMRLGPIACVEGLCMCREILDDSRR